MDTRRLGVRRCLGAECGESFQATWPEQRFCGGASCRAQLEAWVEAKGSGPAARRVEEELSRDGLLYGERGCERAADGCEERFEARSPNQRYCGPCRATVAREKTRDRQRRHRETARLQEERWRAEPAQPAEPAHATPKGRPGEGRRCGTPDRRHASHETCQLPLCDRPGCFRPRRAGPAARYCDPACTSAMRRVLDRERKWRRRGTPAGRLKRRLLEQRAATETGSGRPVFAPP